MGAREDFRSFWIETGRTAGTTILTLKLGTIYATFVSRKLCVSVNSKIVTFLMSQYYMLYVYVKRAPDANNSQHPILSILL